VGLATHERAGLAGDLGGAVGRVVVIDVDRGLGQRAAEVGDDLGDGRRLVESGHQDRQAPPANGPQLIRVADDHFGLGH
jgi:hypothetical protein